MTSAGRPHVRRRIRLAVGGAVVLTALTVAAALNDRGQLVGSCQNPDVTPNPQTTDAPPMQRMS